MQTQTISAYVLSDLFYTILCNWFFNCCRHNIHHEYTFGELLEYSHTFAAYRSSQSIITYANYLITLSK